METLHKIVIVGGGTAGWMAAALLSKLLGRDYEIVLIESDAIGTVGVGEATIPPLRIFHSLLGIDEREFMRATNATIKLGIEFTNWGEKDAQYFHPFGKYGDQFGLASFHQYWLKGFLTGKVGTIGDYSLCHQAAYKGRFHSGGSPDPRSILSTYSYAYHLDATAYAKYLRGYSEKFGARRIEGRIVDYVHRADNGFLKSVLLDDGQAIEGDLFIDCSGFRGLLIGEAMGVPLEDWSHWLPVDRAVAVQTKRTESPRPYTRSIAREFGWQWRIPLQHRTGHGHVFVSDYLSEDEATNQLLNSVDGERLTDPRVINFKTGAREKVWEKNVIAIGLSSGFLEPLESTSIHLIQTGLTKILQWFPDATYNPVLVEEYNALHRRELEWVRDFIILHYKLNARDDSPFWVKMREASVPETLQHRIDMFKAYGKLSQPQGDIFQEASWLAVMLGQGLTPERYDPLVDLMKEDDMVRVLHKMQSLILQAADGMPLHDDFIRNHCAAPNEIM